MFGQRGVGVGVHGQVQPDAEQSGFAPGQPRREVVGVLGGGVGVRIREPGVLGAVAASGLQPGQAPPQPGRGGDRVDRVDVQRHVHPPGVGQQRVQPGRADIVGVAHHRQHRDVGAVGAQVPAPDQDLRGCEHPARVTAGAAGGRGVVAGGCAARSGGSCGRGQGDRLGVGAGRSGGPGGGLGARRARPVRGRFIAAPAPRARPLGQPVCGWVWSGR